MELFSNKSNKLMHALSALIYSLMLALPASAQNSQNSTIEQKDSDKPAIEETLVIADKLFKDTTIISPTSTISAAELENINLMTAEDSVAYEPSLAIRRRYVGDPNGVMGIRGSGMFQTARSLVYADGLPLHYLLQTRFSGSPRWSLVGPDEIETAEVIYGPFSAEYSGNAMGGVVNIKTRTPQERKFTVQGTLLSQDYDVLGTNTTYDGDKVFVSYEDRFGDFSVFASFNRLDNQSQPMSNYFVDASDASTLDAQGITGYIAGQDELGEDVIYIGDSGAETSISELYKLKLGYDLENVQFRATIAFEERSRSENAKNNYLQDSAGNSFWGLGNRNFEERFQDRESLLLGLGMSGEIDSKILQSDWLYDVYATDFEIKKDDSLRTGLNPLDPAFGSRNGRLTSFGDTGWNTLDIKFGTENLFGNDAMRLSLGLYFDSYELEIVPSNINAVSSEFISSRAVSRGETSTTAVFAQWGYSLTEKWDLALGLRYEDWQTKNGFFDDTIAPNRSDTSLSPKFSLAYQLNERTSIRYSLAGATRFALAEELYRNEDAATRVIVSDASLAPEEGIHHNLTIDHQLDSGLLRFNLFYDQIDDTIQNQFGTINDGGVNVSISTFLAIDEVETKGAELIYNQQKLFGSPLDMRFNVAYTKAEIIRNTANPSIEGNEIPRVPEWRANLIMGYPINEAVKLSTSFRYSSETFGDLDNGDTQSNVFGALDSYFFVNAKANWRLNQNVNLSFGVDNIFDELAYVFHPYPSRTVFAEAKLTF